MLHCVELFVSGQVEIIDDFVITLQSSNSQPLCTTFWTFHLFTCDSNSLQPIKIDEILSVFTVKNILCDFYSYLYWKAHSLTEQNNYFK